MKDFEKLMEALDTFMGYFGRLMMLLSAVAIAVAIAGMLGWIG